MSANNKALIPDALAYLQFVYVALLPIYETHPDRERLRKSFSAYSSALLDENLQHSVSESAMREMRGVQKTLLESLL